ncbi:MULTISPECIES: sensor histidine kinase KdpD [unclassified Lysobacter]|uniref:sensor histidine kinase n=1 Tax=unclassified Lysobacter TaxID=2635362 RepID=UPI001BEAFF34|nr:MULTISPECIES: sensor histidine kinase KdpD [unclassified Lysobacter]MBT2748767.1 sensor histidine kinase KdpD [Lysobacter sp. ISL-42]MBT2753117.1 sensor histidine kinase KdpD [Lysobacter sp. ISL-50]MBT2779804.1 sensor histidine kinase KdpD [Lysobacter sp. ISL-54]MBT2782422.1 sensor histidine kinase KdpD [Lysobacter sp. ISL-52]
MTDPRSAQADALMGELQRQGAGRLTIFLGAAPGVGKTYTMLGRARELQRRGIDVVVAIVETHGRAETSALVEGLDVLPRKRLDYQGRTLEEMDLDAVLARKPKVALVDELAHRNAPGSRHERRWQDVLELLDAGIDVYTTINIQHLESLNDVIHRITGVRVSETVPDALFDRLRDIVLVDLPPRELIERLQQGKVYVPEQAAHALQAFFSPSNLTALRELAMQTAADRVDSDLREAQTARGLPGVPLRRAVMVAIDGLGQSEYLVRVARRIAERRDSPWIVVTVHTGGAPDEARQSELDRAFALARRLGGEAVVLHGNSIVDALLDHGERAGVSTIVLGRTRERPLARMINRTLTQQLIQRGAHYELTIVSTPEARAKARRSMRDSGGRLRGLLNRSDAALAVVAATLATALAWVAERWIGLGDLSLIFIVAVVVVAARTRMTAAVIASVLCFLAYNFFFIEPRFTLLIGARQGVATVMLFLAAALVAGRLASKLRMQVLALRASNAHATELQSLGRELSTAADVGQVVRAGRNALKRSLGVEAFVYIGDAPLRGEQLPEMNDKDRAAADWSLKHRQPAGRYTDTLAGSDWWLLPLKGSNADAPAAGVVGLRFAPSLTRLGAEQRRLAEAMTDDVAQAVLRTRLVADLEDSRVSGETERLRSALLSSVSHDLRSPLASIIGAASSLDNYAEAMPREDRHALLETIRIEGERLDRYIQNLLDMTRLGHGGLALNRDWIGVDELIGSAVTRLQRYEPGARFEVRLQPELGPIWVHPALIEQALFNVIENAVKFSPPDTPVSIDARRVDNEPGAQPEQVLRIDVSDRGPGIPEDERARIFDMFYSVERGDRGRQGTGLGLAICQGMIGAHGGNVVALPGQPDAQGRRGTTIRITLPPIEPEPAAAP